MPERPGGFERSEIDKGFKALASAGSAEDIYRLIDTMAVLRSPIFHAQLRQYRLANMAEFRKTPDAYRGFMLAYDTFFTRLHYLVNFEQSQSESEPDGTANDAEASFIPPYFAAVRSTLGDTVPPPAGQLLNTASDPSRIAAAIEQLTGKRVQLPAWEATPGTLWGAVVVACGKCRAARLAIRPYYLDILGHPATLDLLRVRAFEWSPCPTCLARAVLPIRTWICEQPAPHDPLAAICTLCRVRETEIIFRPPPGTERRPEADRILEVRLDMMIRQLGIEQPDVAGVVITNGIAYSLEELLWRIDQMPATVALAGHQDLRVDLYQKLVSGLLNWEDAERLVRTAVENCGMEWPIEPAQAVGDLMKALVINLVAEAAAEVQGKPLETRVLIGGLVSQCYVALGELARARIWLARVRDMAVAGGIDAATLAALEAVEADLLRAEGRHDEAARILATRTEPEGSGDDLPSRLERAQFLQNTGIDLSRAGRLAEAIEALREGLSLLRALAAETDPPLPDVRHILSGTLANLAVVYVDCARNSEVLSALAVKPIDFASLPPRIRQSIQRLGSAQALLAMQDQMLGPVNALLEAEFPGEITAAALRARAAELFREAITEGVDYEYLCIQSHGLSHVLLDSGDLDGAAEAARACLSYAAQIRSYGYMAAASWVLATVARERGDAPTAIQALADCLQAEMRQTIRSGSAPTNSVAVGVEALNIASHGADPLTAILVAESAKAIATSVSLIRAVPLQGGRPGQLKQLYEKRETLRLRSIWEASDELDAQIAAAEEAIVRTRRDLVVRDPRAASWHDATYLDISRPGPVRKLLADLGPRTTYVGFVVDRDRLFAYAVWAEDQILAPVSLPSDALARLDPETLAPVLLQPLAARLQTLTSDDYLIMSPCLELSAVPFGLLRFGGQPLCTRATISIVNGSGMLEACASRPALALHAAVAVGAPARPDTAELPHAAREVEQIARQMETAGVQVQPLLLGAAATVPALAARVATADLIHFACHAFVASDKSASRLMLAPAPLARDSGVLSDDRIVSDLALKAGCHVNLAACHTSISGGEGAYFAHGLVAAFLVAGASSVLATLWPLSDAPAATFQATYYDHLIRGVSPAFALAATQRAAIRGDLGDEPRRPENFGGYVLHGVAGSAQKTETQR